MEALARGIVHGTAGNMSIRDPESGLIAISPSGIPYPDVTPADIVIVNDAGDIVDGRRKPSSETPLHTMVMRARPDVRAIVHTHSHYSTVVSCIRPYLPPILTEVCLVVGARVPVTRYGLTGTPDFGESVIEVLEPDSRAIILKNHGLICFGDSFAAALGIAEVVEEAARVYVNALAANGGREPELVPEALIPEMTERFRQTYGQ
jgi:L-fuculose-phosphate aldolase